MTATPAHHPDEIRRLAVALLTGVGLPAGLATELAGHLLWFDLAGFPQHGLATLPEWLGRLERREIDPQAAPRFSAERLGTAIVEAGAGPGPCVLREAARAAANKAREAGVALVRVTGVGPTGPPAPIAAELASGPVAAALLGPDGAWAIAAPSAGGPPSLADSTLADAHHGQGPPLPWTPLLEPGDWLIHAVAVPALESLSALSQRVASCPAGWLDPAACEARRAIAYEQGMTLAEPAWRILCDWAERLGVAPPTPRSLAALT